MEFVEYDVPQALLLDLPMKKVCPEFVQLICWTIITFIIQSFAIKLVSQIVFLDALQF